jgi:hypothetical protein
MDLLKLYLWYITNIYVHINYAYFLYYYLNLKSDIWILKFQFIETSLGGMGCNHRSYKKQFQIANLLKVDSKLEFKKNKLLTSCNVSKCPYGS